MKTRISLFVFLLLSALTVCGYAQSRAIKTIKFIAPKYPPAAAAIGAKGDVIVEVKIDKDGNVVAAQAESGHPFLKAFSAEAAKLWKFNADPNSLERTVKLTFAYSIKNNNDFKNNYKNSTYKIKLRKPFRLEIQMTDYPRIDV